MLSKDFSIHPTTIAATDDRMALDILLDRAFGLGRRTKTSYRLREGEVEIPGLSFVARNQAGQLIGTISFWHLKIGPQGDDAILLGPLAVDPDWQDHGIGLALMQAGLKAAQEHGYELVLLVGDQPYYARIGFNIVPSGQLIMPGPVDPQRLLYCELTPGALQGKSGLIMAPGRFHN